MEDMAQNGLLESMYRYRDRWRQVESGNAQKTIGGHHAMALKIEVAYRRLFGPKAPIVLQCRALRLLGKSATEEEYCQLRREFESAVTCLEAVSEQKRESSVSSLPVGNTVLIIHGHDEVNKLRLQNFLQGIGLPTVVMQSKPGKSQSLLQKFDSLACTCAFAFALMTPDDEVVVNDKESYVQARPNVFFEAGWFVGRLGRSRVCLLLKQRTRVHSDMSGISRVEFQDDVMDRRSDIEQELRAAGLI